MNPDVVVVGGGPAGLGAAVRLARRGASVLVCECARDPGDKPCGEGLLPRAVDELASLGVSRAELLRNGYELRGVRYISARGVRAEGRFAEGPGLGVSRRVLQRFLRDLAERTPGLVRYDGDAGLVLEADGTCRVKLDGRVVTPRLVLGADGLASRTRAAARLAIERAAPFRYGIRQHFSIQPWSDHVEVHFGRASEAYVTPVGAAEVNVAFLWQTDRARPLPGGMQLVPHLLGQFPALARKLAGANRTTDARARGPLFSRVPRPARDGLLLLGDAAGYIDPITGEGVGLALAQARLLARHLPAISSTSAAQLCENAFEPYLRAERRLVRSHVVLTRLLLGLRRAPGLMERAIRALSEDPQLFATFLSINQGAKPLRSLSFVSALGLARRIALAPKLELGR